MEVMEIESLFKEIFEKEKGLVKTVDSVYEKSDDGDFLKLVISIHDLRIQDTLIIHTKFIFKTDLEKRSIIENSLIYLYDINCVYHTVEFENTFDLEKKIKNIIDSNKFGKDIQTLSEFIDTPVLLLSNYFSLNKIIDYSIEFVNYEPKFKIKPCAETTFDFEISVKNGDNDYLITLCVSKKKDSGDDNFYRFRFRLLDNNKTIDVDSLLNLHHIIGYNIVEMLNEILK